MSLFEEIYSLSTENHGIVTAAAARKLHVRSKDLVRWVRSGRLIRVGYGVYRATQYPPSCEDQFAIAVEEVGPTAYLYGESVLALHELAATNANYIHVATPARIRRKLPRNYIITKGEPGYRPANVRGIRAQPVSDAIRSCMGALMPERLEEAATKGYELGLLDKPVRDAIIGELYDGAKATTKRA